MNLSKTSSDNPYASPQAELRGGELPVPNATAFNALSMFGLFRPTLLFRIYPTAEALYVIYLTASYAHYQGGWLTEWMQRPVKQQEERLSLERDQLPVEDLLLLDERNFKVPVNEIVRSSIEPRRFTIGTANHSGRLLIQLQDKQRNFDLLNDQAVQIAVTSLPPVLGQRLQVNVEWNDKNCRYVRLQRK